MWRITAITFFAFVSHANADWQAAANNAGVQDWLVDRALSASPLYATQFRSPFPVFGPRAPLRHGFQRHSAPLAPRATGKTLPDGTVVQKLDEGIVFTFGGPPPAKKEEAKQEEKADDLNVLEKMHNAVETATGIDLDGDGGVGTVGGKGADEEQESIFSPASGRWDALIIGFLFGGVATVVFRSRRDYAVSKAPPLLLV